MGRKGELQKGNTDLPTDRAGGWLLYVLALGFYCSMSFEVPKLKSGRSALEAESESLDSYTADSDTMSR